MRTENASEMPMKLVTLDTVVRWMLGCWCYLLSLPDLVDGVRTGRPDG